MVDVKKRYARPTLRVLGTREEARLAKAEGRLLLAMEEIAEEALVLPRKPARKDSPKD